MEKLNFPPELGKPIGKNAHLAETASSRKVDDHSETDGGTDSTQIVDDTPNVHKRKKRETTLSLAELHSKFETDEDKRKRIKYHEEEFDKLTDQKLFLKSIGEFHTEKKQRKEFILSLFLDEIADLQQGEQNAKEILHGKKSKKEEKQHKFNGFIVAQSAYHNFQAQKTIHERRVENLKNSLDSAKKIHGKKITELKKQIDENNSEFSPKETKIKIGEAELKIKKLSLEKQKKLLEKRISDLTTSYSAVQNEEFEELRKLRINQESSEGELKNLHKQMDEVQGQIAELKEVQEIVHVHQIDLDSRDTILKVLQEILGRDNQQMIEMKKLNQTYNKFVTLFVKVLCPLVPDDEYQTTGGDIFANAQNLLTQAKTDFDNKKGEYKQEMEGKILEIFIKHDLQVDLPEKSRLPDTPSTGKGHFDTVAKEMYQQQNQYTEDARNRENALKNLNERCTQPKTTRALAKPEYYQAEIELRNAQKKHWGDSIRDAERLLAGEISAEEVLPSLQARVSELQTCYQNLEHHSEKMSAMRTKHSSGSVTSDASNRYREINSGKKYINSIITSIAENNTEILKESIKSAKDVEKTLDRKIEKFEECLKEVQTPSNKSEKDIAKSGSRSANDHLAFFTEKINKCLKKLSNCNEKALASMTKLLALCERAIELAAQENKNLNSMIHENLIANDSKLALMIRDKKIYLNSLIVDKNDFSRKPIKKAANTIIDIKEKQPKPSLEDVQLQIATNKKEMSIIDDDLRTIDDIKQKNQQSLLQLRDSTRSLERERNGIVSQLRTQQMAYDDAAQNLEETVTKYNEAKEKFEAYTNYDLTQGEREINDADEEIAAAQEILDQRQKILKISESYVQNRKGEVKRRNNIIKGAKRKILNIEDQQSSIDEAIKKEEARMSKANVDPANEEMVPFFTKELYLRYVERVKPLLGERGLAIPAVATALDGLADFTSFSQEQSDNSPAKQLLTDLHKALCRTIKSANAYRQDRNTKEVERIITEWQALRNPSLSSPASPAKLQQNDQNSEMKGEEVDNPLPQAQQRASRSLPDLAVPREIAQKILNSITGKNIQVTDVADSSNYHGIKDAAFLKSFLERLQVALTRESSQEEIDFNTITLEKEISDIDEVSQDQGDKDKDHPAVKRFVERMKHSEKYSVKGLEQDNLVESTFQNLVYFTDLVDQLSAGKVDMFLTAIGTPGNDRSVEVDPAALQFGSEFIKRKLTHLEESMSDFLRIAEKKQHKLDKCRKTLSTANEQLEKTWKDMCAGWNQGSMLTEQQLTDFKADIKKTEKYCYQCNKYINLINEELEYWAEKGAEIETLLSCSGPAFLYAGKDILRQLYPERVEAYSELEISAIEKALKLTLEKIEKSYIPSAKDIQMYWSDEITTKVKNLYKQIDFVKASIPRGDGEEVTDLQREKMNFLQEKEIRLSKWLGSEITDN